MAHLSTLNFLVQASYATPTIAVVNTAVCSLVDELYGLSGYMTSLCVIDTPDTYDNCVDFCEANGMTLLAVDNLLVHTQLLLWATLTFGVGSILGYDAFYCLSSELGTCEILSSIAGLFTTSSTSSCSSPLRSICEFSNPGKEHFTIQPVCSSIFLSEFDFQI